MTLIFRDKALSRHRNGGRELEAGRLTGTHCRIIDLGAAAVCRRGKKRGVLRCNGTRRVTIKTLHGACAFVVQRFQGPRRGETTYLELTEQLCEGSMSARLAEFSAYYSNRMSYDEVAGLLERVTGQPVLSDQTIQHLVVAKAVEVSQQWQSECQADTAAPLCPEVMPQVD
jgi:hypothetical protein